MFKEFISLKYRVRIIPMYDLVGLFIKAWYDKDCEAELNRLKVYYDFLGIEEINKEYRTSLKRDHDDVNLDIPTTALDNVLRARVQRSLPTLFTSNLDPKNISSKYSVDIASMLMESCIDQFVGGSDYRDKIHKKNLKLIS